MRVDLGGDWVALQKALKGLGDPLRVRKVLNEAILREAHYLRRHIIRGIDTQAPGGKPFKPLSAWTLAARQLSGFSGTKALIRTGQLRNSIMVHRGTKLDEVFLGVHRRVRSKDGRSLANIARIQEFGAGPYIVNMTDKQKRFLAVLARQVNVDREGDGGGGGTVGAQFLVIKIPARPFIGPVLERYAKPHNVRKRIIKHMKKRLNLRITGI